MNAVLRYRRQVGRCPNGGKVCYRTRRKALRVAEAIRAGSDRKQIFAYRCQNCPWWHLTSTPQRRDLVA
jgi:hypothetical protein